RRPSHCITRNCANTGIGDRYRFRSASRDGFGFHRGETRTCPRFQLLRRRAQTMFARVSLSRDDIQRLAISLATDLCREDPPAVRGDMAKVAAAIAIAIAT